MINLEFIVKEEQTRNGFLSIENLSKMLLKLSSLESDIANDYMQENKLLWMIYSWDFQLNREIKTGELLEISTWVSEVSKIKLHREFLVKSKDEVVAKCLAEFLIIDANKRKAIRVPKQLMEYFEINNTKLLSVERVEEFEIEDSTSYTVESSYFDENNHVNNSVYIRWIEKFLDESSDKSIKSLKIVYSKEINEQGIINVGFSKNIEYFEIYTKEIKAKGNMFLF